MKKQGEKKLETSTWNKAGDNEEIFILREQDKSAGQTIVMWIFLNYRNQNCPDEKLIEAFKSLMSMRSGVLTNQSKNAD